MYNIGQKGITLAFTTLAERCEAAEVFCYTVRFADGVEWMVFEDELCVSPKDFCRPDPPARNQKLIDEGIKKNQEYQRQLLAHNPEWARSSSGV